MAWYDNLLQQGKGLYQQGQNWLTGNNLTSQDPSVRNAMALDALGTNNQLQDESFSDLSYQDLGGVHPPRTHSGLQSIMPHALSNWRGNMNQLENWAPRYQPGQPFPHEGFEEMEFDETAQVPSKKGFQFPNIGIMGIMKAMGERFKRSPEKQAEIDAFNQTGMFGNYQGKMWDDQSSGLGKVSLRDPETGAVLVRNKNVDSLFGSKTIEEMAAKKNKWIRDRIWSGKNLSTDLKNYAAKQGMYSQPKGDQVVTGGRWGTTDTSGWSSPGYTTRGGFTGKKDTTSGGVRGHHGGGQDLGNQGGNWGNAPGTPGGWGPGARDGGRIGYQNGELVEQQTDFIEGPQGGEEFQETVVEGQEQPSREQLEALAMHIFQLPLEQLDEQQLVVVYQAAMKEQPMEEAVQEEDVQFAANGGRMGYYGGELVEQQTDFLEGPQENLMASEPHGMSDAFDMYNDAIQNGTFDGTFDEFLDELERMRNKFRGAGAEGGLASIL